MPARDDRADRRHLGKPFAATYDADSEGEEGKFYVWSTSEITDVLGDGADTVLFKTITTYRQKETERA